MVSECEMCPTIEMEKMKRKKSDFLSKDVFIRGKCI